MALITTAAIAAGITGTAIAQNAEPVDQLEVTGAYLHLETIGKQKFVRLVFRTADDLPRRYDGALRAGAKIEGVAHSIGTVKRGTKCFSALSEIKGGSIPALQDNDVVRKGAKAGRRYSVEVFGRDGQGSVTKRLKLRTERKGDAVGKPLGC